jgi:CRISPR-associated protein Cas5d
MGNGPPLTVKVWGDWACFTRPEMKVERVSYPVMTPSAARGVLEAIFWKPEAVWCVHEIRVLNPIRWFSILRNEVQSKASERAARGWPENGGGYFADADRAQRHTLGLRDVAYAVVADLVPKGDYDEGAWAKYRDQFRRRVSRGQCFHRPYLGCREFAAFFGPTDEAEGPQRLDLAVGPMLLDLDYEPDGSGRGRPVFFDAAIEGGVLRVPPTGDALTATGGA